jgi:hypothetical protein
MYIHVDHRWFKTILKKALSVLLIYSIFFTTSANAAVGGWTMSNPVAKGASTVYTGIKNITLNGADYVKKGTAIVTPTATGVAKVLARGVAGYALSVAVEQLLGAVDWVLDPENNQIKYKEKADSCALTNTCRYLYKTAYFSDYISPTAELACRRIATLDSAIKYISNTETSCVFKNTSGDDTTTVIQRILNPDFVEQEDKEKTLPLETVAQKVISNAEGNTDKKADAQVATTAAAADMVAEAESDQTGVKARPIAQQLEASSTTKPADEAAADKANEATGEQTKNPDKPDTTDLKLTFPIFCNWAPTVCEAAQTVISFPKTLTNWWETGKEKAEGWATSISESWTEAKEWAKDDKNPDDTDNDPPEIKDIPIGTLDTSAFKGTPGCPSPIQVPVTFAKSGNVEISYEPICAMASKWSFVAPFIGFFTGALIILGVGRKGEDSDT